jgi:hypothetical protein
VTVGTGETLTSVKVKFDYLYTNSQTWPDSAWIYLTSPSGWYEYIAVPANSNGAYTFDFGDWNYRTGGNSAGVWRVHIYATGSLGMLQVAGTGVSLVFGG